MASRYCKHFSGSLRPGTCLVGVYYADAMAMSGTNKLPCDGSGRCSKYHRQDDPTPESPPRTAWDFILKDES